MSHFETALVAEAVDGGWSLHEDLVYHSDILGRVVTVPTGYVTDLASVPRLFRFIVPVANAKNRRAAVVHDYLCTNPEGLVKDQKQADQVFRAVKARAQQHLFPWPTDVHARDYYGANGRDDKHRPRRRSISKD